MSNTPIIAPSGIVPPVNGVPANGVPGNGAPANVAPGSVVPVTIPPKLEDPWGSLLYLECSVSTELKVPDLTVDDVLRLQPGAVLSTQWRTNRDVPLRVNGRLLGFTEFDSAETMGVRITEFAWEQQR